MTSYAKSFWQILKKSVTDFVSEGAMKYSASLSYYTVFSITPVLVIIIGVVSIFYGREAVTGQIYHQFAGLMGEKTAALVQEALKNIQLSGTNIIATVVGVITLIVGATGVFAELQDSLNKIWNLKVEAEKGWLKFLTNRLISFSMIISLGFLLLVSLMLNATIDFLSDRFFTRFESWAWIAGTLNTVVVFAIITVLFAFIFKFLPDALIEWRDVWAGAMFTAVLFILGKFLIGYYLSTSSVATVFGAAGSLALLLVWVYYSSAILFFGAGFTKNYVVEHGRSIKPDKYAKFIVTKEKELAPGADVQDMEAKRQVELEKQKASTDTESATTVADASVASPAPNRPSRAWLLLLAIPLSRMVSGWMSKKPS